MITARNGMRGNGAPETLTYEGANALADRIRSVWARRGVKVNTWVVRSDATAELVHTDAWVVRSDLGAKLARKAA